MKTRQAFEPAGFLVFGRGAGRWDIVMADAPSWGNPYRRVVDFPLPWRGPNAQRQHGGKSFWSAPIVPKSDRFP